MATSPQTTELLFQIGLGQWVVGTSSGSQYPAQAGLLPTIGPLFAPNLEKAIALKPDLLILDTHNLNSAFAASLQALGIRVFVWNTQSPTSLLSDGKKLARELGVNSATDLLEKMERCLAEIPSMKSTHSFLGFVWIEPPILMGHGAFLSKLLEKMGYQNRAPDRFRSPYLPVTTEWLMLQKVDRVFHLVFNPSEKDPAEKKFRFWWPTLTPSFVALEADLFARASLTPLQNLKRIPSVVSLPGGCFE